MHAFYSDTFVLPLPAGHRFPMDKYSRLRARCLAEGVLRPDRLHVPEAAEWSLLELAHDAGYLTRVRTGQLSTQEQRRIGFPWSDAMVERSRRSAGATLAAARVALGEWGRAGWGIAANLAGGTHHAFPDRGEGFCVFNDAGVAIRTLLHDGSVRRAAVVDCDVHQGNGTAAIFQSDPAVFTFSIHGARNFPFRRERSSLDVELPDGADDGVYLAALELHLPELLDRFQPELVIYLAGADPFHDDRFGRMALSKDGLVARDRFVLEGCLERGVPVVVAMAGGYARDTADTVDIHLATLAAAASLHARAVDRVGTP